MPQTSIIVKHKKNMMHQNAKKQPSSATTLQQQKDHTSSGANNGRLAYFRENYVNDVEDEDFDPTQYYYKRPVRTPHHFFKFLSPPTLT